MDFGHDGQGSCMMSAEMCLRWQESKRVSTAPAVSSHRKQGSKNGEGRCRVRGRQTRNILPSGVRLVNAAGRLARQRINHIKLLHILHFSSHLISSSQPLVATSLCSHTKQARGKIAMACTNQHSKRVKQPAASQHVLLPYRIVSMLHRHPMRRQ